MKVISRLVSKYWYAILIAFLVLIFHTWFFSFGILSQGDWGYYNRELQSTFFSSRGAWSANVSTGSSNLTLTYAPLNAAEQFLHNIFKLDFNITERLLFFFPMVFSLFFGAYLIVLYLFKSRIAALAAGLVFLLNVDVLASNSIPLFCAFGMAALSFYFLLRFFKEDRGNNLIYCLFFLFFSSAYDFRITYISLCIISLYVVYYHLFINRIKKNTFFLLIISILVFIAINLYWLVPLLFQHAITSNELFNRTLFGDSFFDILKSTTLFFYTWTGSYTTDFIVQPIPLYFFLIPFFAFLGLILNRKNKNVLFFGCVALLGVFLGKQAGDPFPYVYQWLYNHFPGFNAFREASKFYFLIALGYSVLIGSFVNWLWENRNKGKIQISERNFLTFLIIFIFLWNAKPVITGELGKLFVTRKIPQDYVVFENFMSKQSGYLRTFWVPADSRWGLYTDQKPKISDIAILSDGWNNYTSTIEGYNNLPINEQITEILRAPYSENLLDNSSVKYVVVPVEDKANDDDFFVNYGGAYDPNIRQWYIDQLEQISWLKKIDIGTTDLVVYENENYRPHIYTTAEKETVYADVPYENIVSAQKNPTEYTMHLNNISAPVFVNFSESFDPNWKVRVGAFAWNKAFRANYFLPDKFHSESDAMLNSFYIDPNYIKQNLPASAYKTNPDGSINVNLTIYFKPQSYFYVGLIISGVTLLGCLGYLGWDFARRRKKNLAAANTIKKEENI